MKYIWTVSALEQSQSPSMRREWIEIRKYHSAHMRWPCLPPCGGSGLKYPKRSRNDATGRSPSMRREWIEILMFTKYTLTCVSLPPCGGSGLKFKGHCITRLPYGLPPCGGSGLKLLISQRTLSKIWSPSMRREWIEILRF